MKTQLAKWGNSLALRIPLAHARALDMAVGTDVSLSVEKGRMIVTPISRRRHLRELLDGISEENRHAATDWGGRAGREVW